LGVFLFAFAARGEPGLEQRLDAALRHRGLRGATIAALVVDAGTGEALYAHDAGRALVPASNMKLLTSLAVLSSFGPAHRFETTSMPTRARTPRAVSGDSTSGAEVTRR